MIFFRFGVDNEQNGQLLAVPPTPHNTDWIEIHNVQFSAVQAYTYGCLGQKHIEMLSDLFSRIKRQVFAKFIWIVLLYHNILQSLGVPIQIHRFCSFLGVSRQIGRSKYFLKAMAKHFFDKALIYLLSIISNWTVNKHLCVILLTMCTSSINIYVWFKLKLNLHHVETGLHNLPAVHWRKVFISINSI